MDAGGHEAARQPATPTRVQNPLTPRTDIRTAAAPPARPGNTAAPAAVAARLPRSARPELLAPAGDWECVKAAVENGADAIYFGLDRFNARMRARNFTEADLPRLMAFLHRRGVRGYVTFNTLVFTDELPEAEQFLRTIIAAGVDAAIVQDVGICRLIRQLSPDFPIHASHADDRHQRGGNRVRPRARLRAGGAGPRMLARRTSRRSSGRHCRRRCRSRCSSTARCAWRTPANASPANRSAAARPTAANAPRRAACPTNSSADGKTVPLGDRRYLLSPQDLAGLELVPDLARLGVDFAQDRRPAQVARVRREHHADLPAGAGCAVPDGSRGRSATPDAR